MVTIWAVLIRIALALGAWLMVKHSLELAVQPQTLVSSYYYLLPVTVLLLLVLSLPFFFKAVLEYRFNKEFLFKWAIVSLAYAQAYFRRDVWYELPTGHWVLFGLNYLFLTGALAVWYKKDAVKYL